MKNILAFGDSLTWGFVAGKDARHSFEDRWPNALAAGLKGKARVIEEGQNGRTTTLSEPQPPNELRGFCTRRFTLSNWWYEWQDPRLGFNIDWFESKTL